MGAKNVQKTPSRFAEIYIEVGFVAIIVVFMYVALRTIGSDVSGVEEQESTAAGVTGMLVLLIAGAGLLFGSTTLLETPEGRDAAEKILTWSRMNEAIALGMKKRGEDWHFEKERKQHHLEPNVHSTGLAAVVMAHNKNFKFLEDEYPTDHDYSRDKFRESEEADRARDAKELSKHYNQEKKERAEQEKNIHITIAKQQQQSAVPVAPQVNMFATPYQPYIQAPMMPGVAPMPVQHAPTIIKEQNKQGAPKTSSDFSNLLPPYPVGHPFRDETPYGMVLVVGIAGWLAALEFMRRRYFFADDGKTPRKPNSKESGQIEIIRMAGSAGLGLVTFLYVRQIVENNPGTGSHYVAALVGLLAGFGAFFGSEGLVEPARETVQVPKVCRKYSYDTMKNDPDYKIYKEEIQRKCTYGDRPTRDRYDIWWDWIYYYLRYWIALFVFAIFFTILRVKTGAAASISDIGLFFLLLGAAIIIPWFDIELPWKPHQATLSQQALARFADKLSLSCKEQCLDYCRKTYVQLIDEAKENCVR